LLAALPLVLLAIALAAFTAFDTRLFGLIGENPPPADELSVSRVEFQPDKIVVRVSNPQPDPITIAVAAVDDGIANFEIDGSATLERFDRRSVTIPFAWNAGEPYTIGLTSSTGIQTTTQVTAAVAAITAGAGEILGFGLIGLLVGFLPVALGLMWLPGLRELSDRWLTGFMALTVGLLSFLAVDALFESLEQQALLPSAFGGLGLMLLGVSLSFVGVGALSSWLQNRSRKGPGDPAHAGIESVPVATTGAALAFAIALGIGFHNLGEGLAIGTSFAVGELAFSSLLIIGFAVHNITEGLAIAVPLADERPRPSFSRLLGLAAIAGLPAVLGAWIGGFFTSTMLAVFFFAVAAGAAAQVVYEVGSFISRRAEGGWRSPAVAAGFVAGVAIMFVTSLIAG
jgi:zinc transporter ZupT